MINESNRYCDPLEIFVEGDMILMKKYMDDLDQLKGATAAEEKGGNSMRLTLKGIPIGKRYFTRAQALAAYIRLSRCIQGLGIEDGYGNSVESK